MAEMLEKLQHLVTVCRLHLERGAGAGAAVCSAEAGV